MIFQWYGLFSISVGGHSKRFRMHWECIWMLLNVLKCVALKNGSTQISLSPFFPKTVTNELFNLVVFILKVNFYIHLVTLDFHKIQLKRRYADSHVCWFRTIFGWKAMSHSTCHKIIFLIAFAWSLTIFAFYLKLSPYWPLDAWHFSCTQNRKTMVYWGLSDLGIHVACLSRKSFTVTTHIYSLSEEFPTQKLFLTSL